MPAGRVKVFTSTSFRRAGLLRQVGLSAQRLGLDCEIVDDTRYSACDVAVVWGLPKLKPGQERLASRRQKLRQEIRSRHKGHLVVIEAPVIGRRVAPRPHRPWLLRKLASLNLPGFEVLQSRSVVDPFAHYRIGLGGFSDDGGLALAPHCKGRWRDVSRRLELPEPKPYRRDGQHILVIGQVTGDTSLRGLDMNGWLLETCSKLRRLTERPIIVRPHPFARDFHGDDMPRKLAKIGAVVDDPARPLAASLSDAWSVVTYSSGASFDALLAGVPAVAMSPASFAWEVTDHTLEQALGPTLFERRSWLEKIAAAHWFEDEIARGDVWAPLLEAFSGGNFLEAAA